MARSRGFPQVRSPRRRKAWDAGIGQVAAQTQITGSGVVIVNATALAAQDGLTILRVRGNLTVRVVPGASLGDGYTWAFGIGIATSAALTAGVASIPTPITEQAWDGWMFWATGSLKAMSGTVATALAAGNLFERVLIDTKAMRKIAVDEGLFGAIETTEIGTSTLDWHVDTRILSALP